MNPTTVQKIAIYCRVSTDEQASEGISLDEQQTRLRAYCVAMGMEGEVAEYVDDGYSAKSLDRPALQRLLRDISKGRVSKLMVTKLDRLSRRLLDLLKLIESFQLHDVAFVSTSESFDTDTPSGRLTLHVLGAVAEFERERIRERVMDNMVHAAKAGKWLTRHPYGYRLEDKRLVVHEAEADIVRRVFHQFTDEGMGYWAIAKQLNADGIPSRFGKLWSVRTVKNLLTNPVYAGMVVWGRVDSGKKGRSARAPEDWIVAENCHEPIVTPDLWRRVQSRMHAGGNLPSRAQTSPHLLSGLLRCGQCGTSMTIGFVGHPSRRRVYRCSAYNNHGTCRSKPFSADALEETVLYAVSNLVNAVDRFQEHHITLVGKQEATPRATPRRVAAAKARLTRQIAAYREGFITLDELRQERDEFRRLEAAFHQKQLEQSLPPAASKVQKRLADAVSGPVDALMKLPVPVAKAHLHDLVACIVVHAVDDVELVLKSESPFQA